MEKENLLFKNKIGVRDFFLIFTVTILHLGCTYDNLELNPCESVDVKYTESIAPLIQTSCALSGCHNGDSTSVGNFNLYDEVKMRVENGQFKLKVIDSKSMPPTTQPPLTSKQFTLLKCWIDAGAPNN